MEKILAFSREAVQAKLLAALFKQDLGYKLALKGGMAMRAAYGSLRYTKDIDLAADSSLRMESVEKSINLAVKKLVDDGLLKGVKVTTPHQSKRTETTLRWKINGTIGSTAINLTVEVSRRQSLNLSEIKRITYTPPADYGTGPIAIEVYDQTLMAASKVDCLCNPHREEPRDIHDLSILIGLEVTPSPELVARLGRERLKVGLENLWPKIEKLDFAVMNQALAPYMPEAIVEQMTPEIWDDIRMNIGYRVEKWITDALEYLEGKEQVVYPQESIKVG